MYIMYIIYNIYKYIFFFKIYNVYDSVPKGEHENQTIKKQPVTVTKK